MDFGYWPSSVYISLSLSLSLSPFLSPLGKQFRNKARAIRTALVGSAGSSDTFRNHVIKRLLAALVLDFFNRVKFRVRVAKVANKGEKTPKTRFVFRGRSGDLSTALG